MKPIISMLLSFVVMQAVAQKTEQLYLSGTDSKRTVEWDFFCKHQVYKGSFLVL
jgi:hypothetical protein